MFHCRAALTSGNVIRFVKQFILLYASSSKSEARAELNRAGATVLCALQAADRTERRVTDILRYADWFAFLLRGFISRQRVSVYPVERVFLAEIRGKTVDFMP